MTLIDSTELSKKIKSGELSNLYYIYGKDIMTIESISKAVLKKYLGKDWKNEYIKIEGKNVDVNNLIDTLESCPMFADYNAVLLNDLNANDLSANEFKQLTDIIEYLPESTVLIINITGIDLFDGKKAATKNNKKLIDTITKHGVVCDCAVKALPQIAKAISDKAAKQGCSISDKNARMLAEYCLLDSMQINNELSKLCSYKENSEILAEDIETLVSGQIETDSFKLAKAVISMNSSLSFILLDDLLNKRTEPIAVLSAISMSFLDLYRARAAMTVNKRADDVVEDFQYKGRAFAVNNAYRDCRKISLESLRKCISILKDTDRSLKTSSAIPKVILETAITKMLVAVRNK